MDEPRIGLIALHKLVMTLSSPERHIRRVIAGLDSAQTRLELDAMTSGAMPGEFQVVMVFKGRRGLVMELR